MKGDSHPDPLVARVEELGRELIRAERTSEAAPIAAKTRLRWLKRALRRLIRFQVRAQSEFNAASVDALRRAHEALREAAARVARAESAQLDTIGRVESIDGHIVALARDVQRSHGELAEASSTAVGRIEAIESHIAALGRDVQRSHGELAGASSAAVGRIEAIESHIASLRRDVQRSHGELAGASSAAVGRAEALETHLARLQRDVQQSQTDWTRTLGEGLTQVESSVHAQGRHLDDVAGQVVHLADEQRDVLDIGLQLPRLAEDLRARIGGLERVLRPDVALDHFDFARRFRGDPALIKKRLQSYARLFGDVRRVLDLGCGRGEFLEACAELGIGAYGIDSDPEMVGHCQMKGFEAGHGDALAHLASLEDRSLDGIFSAQVVEHLTTPELVDLVGLAAAKLKRGALFVAETINPDTFSALRWFFLDLTHRQPIPSATLKFLLEKQGFVVRDILYSSPIEEGAKLSPLPGSDDAAAESPQRDWMRVYNQNVERLNGILYGPQDYAVIAER